MRGQGLVGVVVLAAVLAASLAGDVEIYSPEAAEQPLELPASFLLKNPISFIAHMHHLFYVRKVVLNASIPIHVTRLLNATVTPDEDKGYRAVGQLEGTAPLFEFSYSPFGAAPIFAIEHTDTTLHPASIDAHVQQHFHRPSFLMFVTGVVLMLLAERLSRNLLFYYASTTVMGVAVVLVAALFLLTRELNRRVSTIGAAIFGLGSMVAGAIGLQMTHLPSTADLLQMLWEVITFAYPEEAWSYVFYGVVGLSFIISYYFGPPSVQTRSTLAVAFKMIAGCLILAGIQDRGFGLAVVLVLLIVTYFHSTADHDDTPAPVFSPASPPAASTRPAPHFQTTSSVPPSAQRPTSFATPASTRAKGPAVRLQRLRDEILDSPIRVRHHIESNLRHPDKFLDYLDGDEAITNREYLEYSRLFNEGTEKMSTPSIPASNPRRPVATAIPPVTGHLFSEDEEDTSAANQSQTRQRLRRVTAPQPRVTRTTRSDQLFSDNEETEQEELDESIDAPPSLPAARAPAKRKWTVAELESMSNKDLRKELLQIGTNIPVTSAVCIAHVIQGAVNQAYRQPIRVRDWSIAKTYETCLTSWWSSPFAVCG
ncbi:uncharacterized protein MONBRDRAFT_4730 [Monosiga brevicollis MX1]|uniref:Uncharacterized protein n=1 Tax=Monosiga brevicollis TaxID=81824 RepID=A9UNR7_MONBE|nr:uncharacterized protein MONBRDRAFT_4730 [Monosiga brevicollis MX1]EDQ92746.1 predicted protein [Monosiga brevicollis MX1]|eukprot:XP_001742508.1 hypothetical protein [Monosiga brevicollis MX1]